MSDTSLPAEITPDADLSGRQLGDYHLLRRLGRGGMAEVYLAEQQSLRRQVALKVLRSSLAHDEKYVKRFRNEAQAAASLVHANIVQIYDVGDVEGIHYIAQEYVQGQNLRELLVRHGPPDVKLAVKILRQAAAALHRAAERGIVHRDIKPENIMITRSGEVKVADFGLARLAGDGDTLNLTQVGVTMGTPLYMSPEQVEGKPIDHRSDTYSLGVTCYHMLAGAPPFRGETALSVAVQHLKSEPPRLENIRPDLPIGLCRIVHKMLEKDPAHRYNSARELLRDLRAVQMEVGDDGEDDDDLWDEIAVDLAGRVEATHRLDELMKTEAVELHRGGRSVWLWAGAALLAAGAVAVAVALGTSRPSLLADADPTKTAIPKQPSPGAQYWQACRFPNCESVAHWLSVGQYYPNDEYYVRLAKKELALLYLRDGDYDLALVYFNEFANFDDIEESYRAFGLAGKCIIYSAQDRHLEALETLDDLRPLVGKLERRMSNLLRPAVQASYSALNREFDQRWEDLQQQLMGGNEAPME